jgi:hypothetical protein
MPTVSAADTYHSFQNNVSLGILIAWIHDSRAIDQEDALEQRNVLPHFGLTRNRCDLADLLLAQRVDDGTLADIGIANETNADLLFVLVQL